MWDEQLRSARSKPSSGKSRMRGWLTRPPLAAGHLHRVDADHLTFRLKTPLSDGTTHLLLSPLELLEKLAGLIPPPRLNRVRDHGLLAPHAHDRRPVGGMGAGLRPRCDPLSRLWRATRELLRNGGDRGDDRSLGG